jgi:hypothetical protein
MLTKEKILENSEKIKHNNSIVIEWEGDVNDGDYVNDISYHTIEEFTLLLPVLHKIVSGNFKWEEREEYLTDEENDLLDEVYLTYSDYEAHSVWFDVYFLEDETHCKYKVNWKNI